MKALSSDVRAAVPLEIIQEMYRVEREAGEQALPPENRRTLRQSKTQPLLNQLGDWVKEVHPSTPPKSPLGQALTYLLNQWTALSRFLEDGRLLLDNNDCERALRHVAVGRKIIFLRDRMPVASGRQRSTPSCAPPTCMGWSRRPISRISWKKWPGVGPRPGLKSCCLPFGSPANPDLPFSPSPPNQDFSTTVRG